MDHASSVARVSDSIRSPIIHGGCLPFLEKKVADKAQKNLSEYPLESLQKKPLIDRPVKSLVVEEIDVFGEIPVGTDKTKQDSSNDKTVSQRMYHVIKRGFSYFNSSNKVYIQERLDVREEVVISSQKRTLEPTETSSANSSNWTEQELSLVQNHFLQQFEGEYEDKEPEDKISLLKTCLKDLTVQFEKLSKQRKCQGPLEMDIRRFERIEMKAHIIFEKIDQLPPEYEEEKNELLEKVEDLQIKSFPSRFINLFTPYYDGGSPEGKINFLKQCCFELKQEGERLQRVKGPESAFEKIEQEIQFLRRKMKEIPSLSQSLQNELEDSFEDVAMTRFNSRFFGVFSPAYEVKTTDEKIEILDTCFIRLQKEMDELSRRKASGKGAGGIEERFKVIEKEVSFLMKQIQKLPSRQEEVLKKEQKIEEYEKKIKKLIAKGAPVNFLEKEIHAFKIAEYTFLIASEMEDLLELQEEILAEEIEKPYEKESISKSCNQKIANDILNAKNELLIKRDPFPGLTSQGLAEKKAKLEKTAIRVFHLKTRRLEDVRPLLSEKVTASFSSQCEKKDTVIRSLQRLPAQAKANLLKDLPNPSHRPVVKSFLEKRETNPTLLSLEVLNDIEIALSES